MVPPAMGNKRNARTAGKKRDWVEIVAAPLLIGLIVGVIGVSLTAWFSKQQDQRQNTIEERRAKSERELEEQRAQDEALQLYLDQMSMLLLDEDLRKPGGDS